MIRSFSDFPSLPSEQSHSRLEKGIVVALSLSVALVILTAVVPLLPISSYLCLEYGTLSVSVAILSTYFVYQWLIDRNQKRAAWQLCLQNSQYTSQLQQMLKRSDTNSFRHYKKRDITIALENKNTKGMAFLIQYAPKPHFENAPQFDSQLLDYDSLYLLVALGKVDLIQCLVEGGLIQPQQWDNEIRQELFRASIDPKMKDYLLSIFPDNFKEVEKQTDSLPLGEWISQVSILPDIDFLPSQMKHVSVGKENMTIFNQTWLTAKMLCSTHYVFTHGQCIYNAMCIDLFTYLRRNDRDFFLNTKCINHYFCLTRNLHFENADDFLIKSSPNSTDFTDYNWRGTLLAVDGDLYSTILGESALYYFQNQNLSFSDAMMKSVITHSGLLTYCAGALAKISSLTPRRNRMYLIAIPKHRLEDPQTNYVYAAHTFGKTCQHQSRQPKHHHELMLTALKQQENLFNGKGAQMQCPGKEVFQYRILMPNLSCDPEAKVYAFDQFGQKYQHYLKVLARWVQVARDTEHLNRLQGRKVSVSTHQVIAVLSDIATLLDAPAEWKEIQSQLFENLDELVHTLLSLIQKSIIQHKQEILEVLPSFTYLPKSDR